MRKFHVAGVAVTALTLTLTAGGFASPVTQRAGPARSSASSPWPGNPMVLARGQRPPATNSVDSSRIFSTNWAGYAAARRGTTFRYMRATFFVPYVNCGSTPNAFSSHWIGLDGLTSRSVEQLGVEASCTGSKPLYYAWFEMFPKVESPVFVVRPGNSIAASVYYNASSRRFVLSLKDTTTGRHFRRSRKCAAVSCARSSAEAISEAPADNSGVILPLANYRAEGFSDVALTSTRGLRATLTGRAWNTFQIVQIGGTSGKVAGQPTALYRGKSFLSYWFRQN